MDRRADRQLDRRILQLLLAGLLMTMLNRVVPTAPATMALTLLETHLPDRLPCSPAKPHHEPKTMSENLRKILRLSSRPAQSKGTPPGNIVMWRGLSSLADIEIGFIAGERGSSFWVVAGFTRRAR